MNIKPYKTYQQQVELLKEKGMIIFDEEYAIKKLEQISYYRLSGFWHPCKKSTGTNKTLVYINKYHKSIFREIEIKLEQFEKGTNFNSIIQIYEFDTKLRLIMLEAIEIIEIFLRSIISHTLSYDSTTNKDTPLNYKNVNVVNLTSEKFKNKWETFQKKLAIQIEESKEDFIIVHKADSKQIPFWVIVQIWDFGTISNYYEILKTNHQKRICEKLEINSPDILTSWLREINILRNRCAHHSRIWNYYNSRALNFKSLKKEKSYHFANNEAKYRIYGLICVINFLLQKIAPNHAWINKVIELINTKPSLPNCNFYSMGINAEHGLDISMFQN